MNGLSLNQFKDFEKWNLVTVRYREDVREIRFVYANDIAYAELKSGEKYPDGATFAKATMKAEDDSAFPDSKVPGSTIRYQFMVHDEKKYADSDGWGYGLFNADGTVIGKQVVAQTKACVACHRIVPERHFVFSQIAKIGLQAPHPQIPQGPPKIEFKTVALSSLKENVRSKIDSRYKSVRLGIGKVFDEVFFGTLYEAWVVVAKQASTSHMPAVLISKDDKYSMVVFPDEESKTCPSRNNKPTRMFRSESTYNVQLCLDPDSI